jgi:hypothetical protein
MNVREQMEPGAVLPGPVTLREVSGADWPALAAGFADYTYEQDHAYAAAGARRIGASLRAFEVRAGDVPVGAACLRIKTVPGLGRGIAWLPAGPMIGRGPPEQAPARAQAVLEALSARLAGREGHVLRLRLPVTGQGVTPDLMARLGFQPSDRAPAYRTVLLDLSQDEAALHKGLHSKWRYELRRVDPGIEITTGRDRDFVERFLTLYRAMREFKSFEERFDPAFLLDMPDTGFDFEVCIARHDGADAGGHVTALTPACATYLFGATTTAGRGLRAGYALNWHAITSARARGVRWYDLGGVDKAENPAGHTFKIRTGGREVAALGPWERSAGAGAALARGIEGAWIAWQRHKGRARR